MALRDRVAIILLLLVTSADAAPLVPPERSAGPRALPLRAVAARPLHAADPAAQAAIALGLPHPRPRARKIAFAAKPGLLIRRAMARRLLCVVIRAGG